MTQCSAPPARKPRPAARYIRRNHMPIAALLLVACNTAIVAALLWRAPVVHVPAPPSVVRVAEKVRRKRRHHWACRCHK